ncbi:MAG: glycine cleavage system protein GcvH [Chloroflexi bacterium]|nr:glycine cleavage system protein GcvH [Chloroflexota bacterium]
MDTTNQDYPDDRRYTAEGVWALLDGEEATIGISAFAQDAMGEIVYVELPAVGSTMKQGECFGPIESVKAVVEPEAPLSGEVVATNDEAYRTPELVNTSPYGEGWLVRLRVEEAGEMERLLSAEDYRRSVS